MSEPVLLVTNHWPDIQLEAIVGTWFALQEIQSTWVKSHQRNVIAAGHCQIWGINQIDNAQWELYLNILWLVIDYFIMTGAEHNLPCIRELVLQALGNGNFRRHGRWLMADWWVMTFFLSSYKNSFSAPSLSHSEQTGKCGGAALKKPSRWERSSSRNGSTSTESQQRNLSGP